MFAFIKKILDQMPLFVKSADLRAYLARSPDEKLWQEAFGPNFPIAAQVMELFCDAFGFDNQDMFKFTPDEHIHDIYEAIYPPKSFVDCLEYETFCMDLERQMRVPCAIFEGYEQKITFRDLIHEAINRKDDPPIPRPPTTWREIGCTILLLAVFVVMLLAQILPHL